MNRFEAFHHSPLGRYDHLGCLKSRRNRPDLNLTRFAIRFHKGEAESVESLSTVRFVVFVARGVSIVRSKKRPCALNLEGHLIVRGRHDPAVIVQNLDDDVSHITLIRYKGLPIRRQADRIWLPCGENLSRCDDLPVFSPDRFQSARFIGHVPGQVQVPCGPRNFRPRRQVAPAALHAQARKLIPFHSKRPSVEEQLNCVAIREAGHGNDLLLSGFPVPMRKHVQHWLVCPLALIEVIAVLLEAASVDYA